MELVVLQHSEDISWTDLFDSIRTVYVKSPPTMSAPANESSTVIRLPNVGREQHSILRHVVDRYETLAERTVFLQGNLPTCGCADGASNRAPESSCVA